MDSYAQLCVRLDVWKAHLKRLGRLQHDRWLREPCEGLFECREIVRYIDWHGDRTSRNSSPVKPAFSVWR